jgi:hypothetical protein
MVYQSLGRRSGATDEHQPRIMQPIRPPSGPANNFSERPPPPARCRHHGQALRIMPRSIAFFLLGH